MLVELTEKEAALMRQRLSLFVGDATPESPSSSEDKAALNITARALMAKLNRGLEPPSRIKRGCLLMEGWPNEAIDQVVEAIDTRFRGFGSADSSHKLWWLYSGLMALYDNAREELIDPDDETAADLENGLAERASRCMYVIDRVKGSTKGDLAVYCLDGEFPDVMLVNVALVTACKYNIGPEDAAVVSYADYVNIGRCDEPCMPLVADVNGGFVFVSMAGASHEARMSGYLREESLPVINECIELCAGFSALGDSDSIRMFRSEVEAAYTAVVRCMNEHECDRVLLEKATVVADIVKTGALVPEFEINAMKRFIEGRLEEMNRRLSEDGPRG